jgi:hypothetical protein
MPVIGIFRGELQAGPAKDRAAQHSFLNRRFRLRRISSNRGIRA